MVWAIIILLLAGIDQIIKFIVDKNIDMQKSIQLIPSFFYLINRKNTGAAWSFLADASWGIYFLTFVSLVITVFIFIVIIRTPYVKLKIILSLLAGGSVGNMIDRLFRGFVIDYLDFHFGNYIFPTFNFADILIVCSTIILCIAIFFDHRMIESPFVFVEKTGEEVAETVGDKVKILVDSASDSRILDEQSSDEQVSVNQASNEQMIEDRWPDEQVFKVDNDEAD